MWIFLSDAFFSIVKAPKAHELMVRARYLGDIERVFPGAKVIVTPRADYRFRALIPRATVAAAISEVLLSIDYSNFKDTVSAASERRYDYHDVWDVMFAAQERETRRAEYDKARRGRNVLAGPARADRPRKTRTSAKPAAATR